MSGGPQIPGFRNVSHLGSGGFADVFLYEQEWPRQRVAVKVVRPDIPLTDREKSMFTTEANAMARLADHPYIVSVMTAGTTSVAEGSRPYLVMRYCPPPDLGQRVQAQPMSVPDALATGIKLASAIETAHRSGIIHRDIKPSNVLVTAYHEPALTDFGIAGRLHELEGDHEVRISYPWSPPELLDGRSNGSVASDVYSLGATIWNLLVGRSPYAVPNGDNSSRALTARILHAAPPRTQRPDVPPALEQLLVQCLSKTPEHRPGSALELARSLQRVEAQQGYARTQVAVEGDRPDTAVPVRTGADDDHTRLKPVSVVSASGPRIETSAPATRASATAREAPLSSLLWWGAGAAGLAVVAGFLFWHAGRDANPGPGIATPTSRHTPIAVAPESVPLPSIIGMRTGRAVTFHWRVPAPQKGDSWELRRPDTGRSRRTSADSVTLRTDQRICLQVRLIRGSATSAWADDCVS